jgi:hypothetical protein
MILDVNKIQEGECLAWVSSPVRTLAVWTSFNKAVKIKFKKTKKLSLIIDRLTGPGDHDRACKNISVYHQ